MSTPTLCLNILILLASISPASFSSSIGFVVGKKQQGHIGLSSLVLTAVTYGLLVITIASVDSAFFFCHFPRVVFLIIALLFAPVCFFLEYTLNAMFIFLATGKIPMGVRLHSSLQQRLPISHILMITLIAVGQEVIYRQVWFAILDKTFHFPLPSVVLISAVVYGFEHLFWGTTAVVSKSLVGIVYGCLYVASGYSISIPIITHVMQNLTLIFVTRGKNA